MKFLGNFSNAMTMRGHKLRAYCKIAVPPLLMHWKYYSLALSCRNDCLNPQIIPWSQTNNITYLTLIEFWVPVVSICRKLTILYSISRTICTQKFVIFWWLLWWVLTRCTWYCTHFFMGYLTVAHLIALNESKQLRQDINQWLNSQQTPHTNPHR